MKKMKRFFAMVTLVAMVFTMLTTAYAEDGTQTKTYTITINDTVSGHKYDAYQIFKGNVSGTTLSNIDWGDGISKDGQDALLAYASKQVNDQNTENAKDGETPVTVSYTKVSELVEYLMTIKGDLPSDFTELAGKYLVSDKKTSSGDFISETKDDNGDKIEAHYTISGLSGGYYLVKQADSSIDSSADDSYTNYMVKVAGDTDISPKTGSPKIQKKVLDNESTTEKWQDTADYNIGDLVPFQLTVTVASNYSTYNSYKLVIHDTASGLEFDKSKADFKVYIVNNETPTDVTDLFNTALSSGDISCNSGSEATNACIFEITFNNLKTFSNQIGDNSKIVINYKATLSENAAIGSTGNPNKTWLVYSNNPYDTNSTGKTPEDENIVYTYQLIIKKVDGNGDALKGAEFKLYSGNPANDDNLIGTLTADEETGTIFTIKGLDAGTYTLKETSTPPGYNTVEDIKITISATHKTDDNGNLVLSALSATLSNLTDAISGDKDNGVLTGTLTANVVNRSGNTLPSAGGMGTKLLYLIGALLVLFAGTMLVAKKRTGSDR